MGFGFFHGRDRRLGNCSVCSSGHGKTQCGPTFACVLSPPWLSLQPCELLENADRSGAVGHGRNHGGRNGRVVPKESGLGETHRHSSARRAGVSERDRWEQRGNQWMSRNLLLAPAHCRIPCRGRLAIVVADQPQTWRIGRRWLVYNRRALGPWVVAQNPMVLPLRRSRWRQCWPSSGPLSRSTCRPAPRPGIRPLPLAPDRSGSLRSSICRLGVSHFSDRSSISESMPPTRATSRSPRRRSPTATVRASATPVWPA